MQNGREEPLMLIKNICAAFIGLSGGFVVAGGVFSFIVMIGIITRLASRTGLAHKITLFETMVILGGVLGNIADVFDIGIPFSYVGITIFGLFSGIFTGCLAVSLAEVLNVIPIFARRANLKVGIAFVVAALALGKGIGSWYQLCF